MHDYSRCACVAAVARILWFVQACPALACTSRSAVCLPRGLRALSTSRQLRLVCVGRS